MLQERFFSVILRNGSYCTDRANAQRIVAALEAHSTVVSFDAFFPDDPTEARATTIQVSDFIRFVEHDAGLHNPALDIWKTSSRKVVALVSRRA